MQAPNKVLLTTLNAKYIHLNLAIRLLYSLNKERGNISWKEFTIKENKDEIADYCKNYDVVAFSCYIWNITPTLEVIKKIKAINPEVKILLGGPEVSYDWENIIALNEVDYIITGEGETAFEKFLNAYPRFEEVPNLVFKSTAGIKHNAEAPRFDLEKFRGLRPYQYDAAGELYNKVCYIETSRGCPYKCEFCLASLDNKVRYLPLEDIKENLLYLMQHGRVIKFLDRTFNIKKDFTIDIFKFILENHKPGNVFQFEITADIVHPDIVKFIEENVPPGLFRFEIGIQTVNQKANLEVSRKQNFEKTKNVILSLNKKVEMHLDLIVGLPLDKWEDIKFSFEEVFKLFPPELQLGFLKFLKGTPVREKYAEHGFVFDPVPPYQIIESNYLSKQELHEIEILEEALEIYWNKKRTVQTLKYITKNYSIFDFMLGLGKHFSAHSDFHKHGLTDVYEIIYDFVNTNYAYDPMIREFIAIDYYLQHKVRPKPLFLDEISKPEKNSVIEAKKLNHHKYRHVILPLNFDFKLFEVEEKIAEGKHQLIIQYNGKDKAEVL